MRFKRVVRGRMKMFRCKLGLHKWGRRKQWDGLQKKKCLYCPAIKRGEGKLIDIFKKFWKPFLEE